MRWIVKEKRYPRWHDERIVKRFAFLPIRIKNERRWLEIVYIKQSYNRRYFDEYLHWIGIEFVTKEDYDKR